jgi:pectin methylesterase-like acyl-CoA thioesterase
LPIQYACATDRGAVALCEKVDRIAIGRVPLVGRINALFFDKDLGAD